MTCPENRQIATFPTCQYEICAANAGGSVRAVRICALNGLYPRRHANFAKAVTATVSADALPAGIETVRVTPLDSYGNRGRALEAKGFQLPLC